MPEDDDAIEMIPVVSSHIGAVGWKEGTLQVDFNNGTSYEYSGVPEDEFDNLREASSVGGYFNQHIKGSYRGTKL